MKDQPDRAGGDGLLPCPFCGNAPKVLNSMHTIYCGADECFGPATTADNFADAKVQWNTRAAPLSGNAGERAAAEPVQYCTHPDYSDWGGSRPEPRLTAKLKNLDAIGFDELREMMAETIHTAFRKGCDGGGSHEVWAAIRRMEPEQWGNAIEWMIWALRVSTDRETPAFAPADRGSP